MSETTPEGIHHENQLSKDEQDRFLIRRDISRDGIQARSIRPFMHALTRAGEIVDVDLPQVRYRRDDGVIEAGLDEDDAYMSGGRPSSLPDEISTTAGMIDWLIRKTAVYTNAQLYLYDTEDAVAFEEYDAFAGSLREWNDKLHRAVQSTLPDGREDLEERALKELRERLGSF